MNSTYSHQTLEQAEETLEFILDTVSEGVWDWNALTGQVHRSQGWFRMLEYDINCFDETVHTWENIIHPEDYKRVIEYFESYIHGNIDTYKIQYRCKKADDSYIWIEDSAKIVEKDKDGKLVRMIGAHANIHDIKLAQEKLFQQNELLLADNKSLELMINKRTDELEKLNKELQEKIKEVEHNATYDYLTNVYNRRMFEKMFEIEVNRKKRYKHPLSIILIDIDNFKIFNDKYGHKVGDEVLVNLSKLLQKTTRESDTIARWGGEEFVIVLPNSTQKETYQKAEDIRKSIENSSLCESSKVTCSFGVVEHIETDKLNTTFIKVDKALYNAKNSGRNKVCVE